MLRSYPALLLATLTAVSPVGHPSPPSAMSAAENTQSGQNAASPGAGEASPAPDMIEPGIAVQGVKPRADPTLPTIRSDQFTDCVAMNSIGGPEALDMTAWKLCDIQLARDERLVIDKCINHDGKTAPAVIIQACNELLDRNLLHGHERFYLFVDRAQGYVALGDIAHAIDDYDKAVDLAPKSAQPYYFRGLFHAVQADYDAALRDFDFALSVNPGLVQALLQRARIHKVQNDLVGARADYSEAIRLKPKAAGAWSERGYVHLVQHDYEDAIKDETQALELDPKLARAWFLRGAAYGNIGDSRNAARDVTTAMGLDPTLDRYVSTKGKTATLTLPPL